MTAYAELGSVLRAAREKAGRTVADVSVDTGLPERYVQALESGDMTILPDLAYARLYYQSYARTLHLDVEEVMQVWPRARKTEPLPAPAPPPSRTWRWPILALAAAVGIWILVQAAGRDGRHPDRAPAEAVTQPPYAMPAQAQDSVALEVSDTLPPEAPEETMDSVIPQASGGTSLAQAPELPNESTTLERVSTPTPQVEAPPAHDPSRKLMTLQVTAAEQSWVVIEADGDTVEARVLVKDQSLSAKAQSEFRLTATNARGMKVRLDGEAVKLDAHKDRPLIRHRITGKDTP